MLRPKLWIENIMNDAINRILSDMSLFPPNFCWDPGDASDKESACQCRRCKSLELNPWVENILWKRAWQSTPVLLPRESRGQRILVHRVTKSQTGLKQLSMHASYDYKIYWCCKVRWYPCLSLNLRVWKRKQEYWTKKFKWWTFIWERVES